LNNLRVTFPSGDTSIQLEGKLHLPNGRGSFPAAVVCHPYPPAGGSMALPLMRAISQGLADAGIVALSFNFRGVGNSGGTFDNGQGEVNDVKGAVDWLAARPRVDPGRIALVGYSFGAVMAASYATSNDVPCALALIGLPLLWNPPLANTDGLHWLLVAGERDQFCPLPHLHSFADQLEKKATVRVIAGADHFLFGYEAEATGIVVDFLQQLL
jgi:alpha/beta superfamily hydrolase